MYNAVIVTELKSCKKQEMKISTSASYDDFKSLPL